MNNSNHDAPTGGAESLPQLGAYSGNSASFTCPKGGRSAGRPRRSAEGLVTVVTVTLNSAATILRTIDSVAGQTYPDIEYIVVDGGSTDETVELLRRREDDIDLWLSEPDRGISDAFNKGIALASGEFVALLNSDDWMEPDHVRRAVERLQRAPADFVFGNLALHEADGQTQFLVAGDAGYARHIRNRMPDINHPSVLCRRRAYARYGIYDCGLRIAMDYEWLLRGFLAGARGEYAPELTAHMNAGGISDRAIQRALAETRDVSIRYGYPHVLAWGRYVGRTIKTRIRLCMERWISKRLSQRLRALIHPGYTPAADRARAARGL